MARNGLSMLRVVTTGTIQLCPTWPMQQLSNSLRASIFTDYYC